MKKYVLIFLLPVLIMAQGQVSQKTVKDTSFTSLGTYSKLLKDFPFIKPVEKTVAENVKVYYDLVYSAIDKRDLHVDLFIPKSRTKKGHSIVVIIHGGGWRSGDKSMDHHIAAKLSSMGFAAATVEYRLSTEALYPAAILDIKSALKWIKDNSSKYNINKDKIVLMGSSSGGHLASLAAVTAGIDKFEDKAGMKRPAGLVKAVINLDGVLDLTTPEESGKDTIPSKPSSAKQWLGVKYKDNPDLWVEASPLTYINKNTPPMLFINSSLPRFHAGRDQAIEKLNKMGIYSEVHTIPNTPHPFWLFHPWFNDVIEYTVGFLNRVLK